MVTVRIQEVVKGRVVASSIRSLSNEQWRKLTNPDKSTLESGGCVKRFKGVSREIHLQLEGA